MQHPHRPFTGVPFLAGAGAEIPGQWTRRQTTHTLNRTKAPEGIGNMAEGHVRRRLVAILAADVVGYSRLMGRDEARTLAALKSLRTELIDPKLAEHNGRIFKATGDGLLAE